MSDSHARFLAHCFVHLAGPAERLPTAGSATQMAQLDRLDGDIDTLMSRIAHIRTWTYITHRGDWVDDAADWQERARGIEDRLSDALHDRITQRFVDRRSAFLVRHLAGDGELLASVDKEGEVRGRGHPCRPARRLPLCAGRGRGRGDAHAGDRRQPGAAGRGRGARAAARRRERRGVRDRPGGPAAVAGRTRSAGSSPAMRCWRRGSRCAPAIFSTARRARRVRQRLQLFVKGEIERRLAPLLAAQALPLRGPGRGLVFQLVDALGCLAADQVSAALGDLDRADAPRARPGSACASAPRASMSSRCSRRSRCAFARCSGRCGTAAPCRRCPARAVAAGRLRSIPICRRRSTPRSAGASSAGWRLRPDRLERLAAAARRRARSGRFAADAELAANAGVAPGELRGVLLALGYRAVIEGGNEFFVGRPRRRGPQPQMQARRAARRTSRSPS